MLHVNQIRKKAIAFQAEGQKCLFLSVISNILFSDDLSVIDDLVVASNWSTHNNTHI